MLRNCFGTSFKVFFFKKKCFYCFNLIYTNSNIFKGRLLMDFGLKIDTMRGISFSLKLVCTFLIGSRVWSFAWLEGRAPREDVIFVWLSLLFSTKFHHILKKEQFHQWSKFLKKQTNSKEIGKEKIVKNY